MHLTIFASIAIAAFVVVYVVNQIRDYIHHSRRAKELGCEPAAMLHDYDPSGIVNLVQNIMAVREGTFPFFVEKQIAQLHEQDGSGRWIGSFRSINPFFRRVLLTNDPQNLQAMLATQFKEFGLGVNRTENFAPLLGKGIFAANGKDWEHSRSMLRPQFSRGQVSDLNLEEDHVKALMTVLERRLAPNRWTDLYIVAIASRMGPQYWLGHTPEFGRVVKEVHDFADYFVQRTLKQIDNEKAQPAEKERYVFLRALAEETRDPHELRSQALNILLAGRDTTASTLGWFFVIMSDPRYVSVFHRLRAIILEEFGTYSQPRDITFERMKSCQYLQWCIHECLRLYPVVPFNFRTALVDTTLPTGGGPDGRSPIYVRKGEDVGYSVYIMHRRKDLWGADAEIFKPERWQNRRPGWDYLPFNGGPRICIGQQFALTEVAYVIVRMMQRIDAIDGSQVGPVRHGLTLTDCPGQGVKVKLHFSE
ncbi:Cytochrome P450 52A12 [Cladobotryum mycophilum]|uniref:Cytochrome P450 52A12 n=1 Tax=Cladobotryum mycophilum TaxID=491253 RepID=A0ABR0SBD8_9HYPO